jgi:1,4-dihydroxy-2-naphthoate octaprenyltransferase
MEGRIETFNAGAEALFGYTPEEVVGKKRVSLFSPGEIVLGHVPKWLKAAREKGEFETDTVFVRKDGSSVAAHIRITPTMKDGKQIGYCGQTRALPDVDPESVRPKTTVGVRIFKGVVVGRLPFLTATLVPILLAAAYSAWRGLPLDPLTFALTLAGGIALHLAANIFNDYFDWRAGTDQANNDYFLPFTGGSRAVELGLVQPRTLFGIATGALLAGLACGIALLFLDRPWVLAFGAGGALLGFFYTAPPLRLAARRGLGELASFTCFGPLMTAGAVYAMTGHLGADAGLLGLPIGFLTMAILWVNEFPDAPSDKATGKTHLVVALGTERARWGYVLIVAASFAAAAALVVAGTLPLGALLALLAVPLAAYASMIVVRHYADRTLIKGSATTIGLHLVAGLLMAAGLLWLS